MAKQVANPDFFLKMVPLMDGGDDVGMVLSPQSFHNLQPHADIFNHANIQFWEYAQHGYDAIDFISCTGAADAPHVPGMPIWCHADLICCRVVASDIVYLSADMPSLSFGSLLLSPWLSCPSL